MYNVKEQWFKSKTDITQGSFTLSWSGIQWNSAKQLPKSSEALSYRGWTAAGTLPRSYLAVPALFLWHQHRCNLCFKPHYLAYLALLFTHFLVSLCFLHHPSNGPNRIVQAHAICCTRWSQASAGQALSSDSLLSTTGESQRAALSIKTEAAPETDLACLGSVLLRQMRS